MTMQWMAIVTSINLEVQEDKLVVINTRLTPQEHFAFSGGCSFYEKISKIPQQMHQRLRP